MKNYLDKIVFIILNYNSCNVTMQCYKDLRNLSDKFNIIIVDNNSSDDSQKQFQNIKDGNMKFIISDSNKGYAAGNNIGLRYVGANMPQIKVAFIINPDIKIDCIDYIYKLYDALMSDNSLAAITSLTIYNGKCNFPNECCWKFLDKNQVVLNSSLIGKILKKDIKYKKMTVNNMVSYVDVVQGCFFGIKMDVLRKIDFLDERTFLYCEEQILGRKIQKIGMKSGVLINTYIYHNHFEKDKTLANRKSLIFHMDCLKNSRKVLIDDYLKLNRFQKILRNTFLELDMWFKKIFIFLK